MRLCSPAFSLMADSCCSWPCRRFGGTTANMPSSFVMPGPRCVHTCSLLTRKTHLATYCRCMARVRMKQSRSSRASREHPRLRSISATQRLPPPFCSSLPTGPLQPFASRTHFLADPANRWNPEEAPPEFHSDPLHYLLLGPGDEHIVLRLRPGPIPPQIVEIIHIPCSRLMLTMQRGLFTGPCVRGQPVHRAICFRDRMCLLRPPSFALSLTPESLAHRCVLEFFRVCSSLSMTFFTQRMRMCLRQVLWLFGWGPGPRGLD